MLGETEGDPADGTADGRASARSSFSAERIGVAAMALGVIEECLRLCVDYAKNRKLWGQETEASQHQLRFGRHQSKSVDLDKLTWYDHETAQGCGVKALCLQAGIPGPDVFGESRRLAR